MFSHPTRFLKLSVLLIAGAMLGGCGLRLDTPPDSLPHLDAGQEGISAATRAEAAITTGTEQMADDASLAAGTREVIASVRDLSAMRLDALGGLWQPWPEGTPAGADPGPAPSPAPATVADLLQMLVDGATTSCQAAGHAPKGEDALLLAAVCAAENLDANRISAASGVALPETKVAVEATPAPNPEGEEQQITDKAVLDQLREAETALDFARFRMETAAAHLSGDDRKWALLRADALAWDVQALVDAGVADVRASQYALNFSDIKQSSDAIRLVNQADADALAAHLQIIALLDPTPAPGEATEEETASITPRRQAWIGFVKADVMSQHRFGVQPSEIFVQLWP